MMPLWNSMRLCRWGLTTVAALVAGSLWCSPAGAIVGGSAIPISGAPYQAALVIASRTNAGGQYCGGTLAPDNRHVVTAAHCVYNLPAPFTPGEAAEPGAISVVTNTATLDGSMSSRTPVIAVSFDPRFDETTYAHDEAVLTLAAQAPGTPVALLSRQFFNPTVGQLFTVSGWGSTVPDTTNPTRETVLRSVQVPFISDATCGPAYLGFDAAYMECASSESADACVGDSGGPLVLKGGVPPAQTGDRLVGIVSFGGPFCADARYPGTYTESSEDTTRAFAQANNPDAPRSTTAPSIAGDVTVGGQVHCQPGLWDGSPSLTFEIDAGATARTTSADYTVQASDVDRSLVCHVKGTNAGGYALADSAAVTVPATTAPPNPAPPAPEPTPTPTPTPTPPAQDVTAPVARVTARSCKANRCTLTVRVSDAGYSAGIRTVQSTVRSTYRSTCTKRGRKVACTRNRTKKLTPTALSARTFRVVASSLPVGTQLFTLLAVDKAGHRQTLATRVTLKTKRAKKK
jgi:trypsin